MIPLSGVPHDDVLDTLESRLGLNIDRERGHYSRYNGTAGFPAGDGLWVRLAWRRPDKLNAQSYTGIEASFGIRDVPRPAWSGSAAWHDPGRGLVWRADVMTLAPAPVVSDSATITHDPQLPERWWSSLREALTCLAKHETSRVCLSQAHLSNRISDVYGDRLDTTITEWACAHGDLGWANVCGPELMILDWEDWGLAPMAYDAACLWAASLRVPELALKVSDTFADLLETRTGRLCRLMLCANVARAYKRSGNETPLTAVMADHAKLLLTEMV